MEILGSESNRSSRGCSLGNCSFYDEHLRSTPIRVEQVQGSCPALTNPETDTTGICPVETDWLQAGNTTVGELIESRQEEQGND